MKDTCTLTWTDASNIFEFVGKTVTVRTKHKHAFRGIVHTVDPITRRYRKYIYIFIYIILIIVNISDAIPIIS